MSCFQAFNKNVTRLVKGKKLQKVLEAVLNRKQQFEETEQQSEPDQYHKDPELPSQDFNSKSLR